MLREFTTMFLIASAMLAGCAGKPMIGALPGSGATAFEASNNGMALRPASPKSRQASAVLASIAIERVTGIKQTPPDLSAGSLRR